MSRNLWAILVSGALLCLAGGPALAQTYKVLHCFGRSSTSGIPYPSGPLVQGPDGMLYGTQRACSNAVCGQLFKVSPDGRGFTVLKTFTQRDGDGPLAGLLLSGSTLYGTTFWGGPDLLCGTLFKINTDGSSFALLKCFGQGAETGPQPGLVLCGTTLYGTSIGCANSEPGSVYRVESDGSGFTALRIFTGQDGMYPLGGLSLNGSTLYATTRNGGTTSRGSVFRINTDGGGFAVLKSFTGPDGAEPCSGVAVSGTTLFGTTCSGGPGGLGTVFSINTDGSGFKVLTDFTASDGSHPRTRPVLSGTTLYGTTDEGGEGYGTVFMMHNDGGGYTTLKRFASTDAGPPNFGLLLSGKTLYGLTDANQNGEGVLFSLSMAPPADALTLPPSQTAEAGSSARFQVVASGDPTMVYQWCFNGTNMVAGTTLNSDLQFTVQPAQAGAYSVIVTNLFGATTSPPAILSVIPPVERRTVPGIYLTGEVGSSLHLEYTDALHPTANWLPLDTVTLTSSPPLYFDLSTPFPPQRFYRAWQAGAPAIAPSLQFPAMIPALTLTGSVGSQLRVDGINAIGPTDAWFTLATVTLTNTTQLYFDVTSIGQPPRLWRIVPLP